MCHVTSYSFGQGKPRSQAKHQLDGNIYLSRDVVGRMTICGIITNLPIICFWITNINFPFSTQKYILPMPVKTPSSLPSLMLLWHQAWSSKSCDNLYIISAAPPQPTFKRGIEQDNLQKRVVSWLPTCGPKANVINFTFLFRQLPIAGINFCTSLLLLC